MSADTPTGCGSTSCIIAPARVGVGVCSCLNELTPALRVPLRAVVAGLRAESTVLASVVEALGDPARPEESPVDAVRRLRVALAVDRLERDAGTARVEALAPAEPGNPEVAWSALRIAAARLGSVAVRGEVIDLHAAVDVALAEARGEAEDSAMDEPSLHECIGMAEALAEGDGESPI